MSKKTKWVLSILAGLVVLGGVLEVTKSAEQRAIEAESARLGGAELSLSPGLGPASTAVEAPGLNEYERLEQAALRGDYQAQRNVAYTLAMGIPHNLILACAWRIVIVESGSLEVDQSDIRNKAVNCDRKLDADGLAAAKAQAKALKDQIASGSASTNSSSDGS